MKKVTDFLKPNILIIFGALLFLYYLNYLNQKEGWLAIGIIAVVLSVYYLAIGIIGLLLGDKLSPSTKRVFDVISVCLFAAFMFTVLLIKTIYYAQAKVYVSFEETRPLMGPTAWVVAILSMTASLALLGVYPVAKFVRKPVVLRFGYLFSAIFALALLLAVLFDRTGASVVLGDFDVLLVAIYIIFVIYLFGSLEQADAAPAPAAAPAPQKEPEPAPAEEPAKEEAPVEDNQ